MKSQAKTKRLLIALSLLATLILLPAATAPAATITADQEDYAPGEIVTLTGAGFEPGSDITVTIKWPPESGVVDDVYWGFFDDTGALTWKSPTCPEGWFDGWVLDSGGFVLRTWKEKVEGEFQVVATDDAGNRAETQFTDSVTSVTITAPTKASPLTITSLPFTITVSFNYVTSATGTTTADADVLGTSATASKIIAPGTHSESIDVTIPAGTVNGSYNVKVTVHNGTGGGANNGNDNQQGAVAINVPSCTAPSITTPPANVTVIEGNPASFSVVATGTEPLSYQWRKGGIAITGATGTSYSIAAAMPADEGSYDVVVTNDCGSATSAAATLTVTAATAPTVTPTIVGTLGKNGWYISDVTVSWTIDGHGSPITAKGGDETTTINYDTTGKELTCWATNAGGTTTESVTIMRDVTPPTISGAPTTWPNENDWYNSDVTVHFDASDSCSGIDAVTPDQVLGEGANQSVTGTATDMAGNSASDTVTGINIDETPPVFGNCPAGGPFILNSGDQLIGPITVDASISGLDEGASTLSGIVDTSSVGSKDVEFTAVDNAGNQANKICSYSVIYNFYGFFPPIDISGKGLFKLGSTIPVKFQLKDANGNLVTTAKAIIEVAMISTADGTNIPEADWTWIDGTPTGGTEFRYDGTSGQYIYNLSTKTLSAGTWYIKVTLDDETYHTAKVVLRK
jgi:hypothetical protein